MSILLRHRVYYTYNCVITTQRADSFDQNVSVYSAVKVKTITRAYTDNTFKMQSKTENASHQSKALPRMKSQFVEPTKCIGTSALYDCRCTIISVNF